MYQLSGDNYLLRYDPAQFAGMAKEKLRESLAKEGVSISAGYTPLNCSPHAEGIAADPHYQRIYGKKTMAGWLERNRCPVNDRLCQEAMWFSQTLLLRSRSEMERIAEAFARVQRRAGDLARA
jgi:perosamine synthetase